MYFFCTKIIDLQSGRLLLLSLKLHTVSELERSPCKGLFKTIRSISNLMQYHRPIMVVNSSSLHEYLILKILSVRNIFYSLVLVFISASVIQASCQVVEYPYDTVSLFKNKGIKPFIVPSLLIVSGVYASTDDAKINKYEIAEERNEHYVNFHVTADDYLQFAPIAAAYGLEFTNLKSKDNLLNKTLKLAKSELMMMAIVYPLKIITHGARPDSGAPTTFPSGHTAQAFLAATFLDEQYRHLSKWISIGGYAVATSVGISRILNNRHWISDVLAGAGIGILSVKMVSVTHQYRWKRRDVKMVCVPWKDLHGMGLYSAISF